MFVVVTIMYSCHAMLQVSSSVKLCSTAVEQSLVLSSLSTVLSNATSLITLRINNVTSLDQGLLADYENSANFSFTASCSLYSPVPSIQTVSSNANIP